MVAIVIVPESLKATAERAVSQLSPQSEGESFTVGLSANGNAPATHWACLPIVSEEAAARINTLSLTPPFAGATSLVFCATEDVVQQFREMLNQLGLVVMAE